MGDQIVDLADVDEAVSVRSRHLLVDLADDRLGVVHGGADDVDADPQAHIPVVVRGRGLDQRHIDRNDAPMEELRNLRQEDRRVIGAACVDRVPHRAADKERIQAEVTLDVLVEVRRNAERPEMEDIGVEERLGVRLNVANHFLNQILRLSAAGPDKNPVPTVDPREDPIERCELLRMIALDSVDALGARFTPLLDLPGEDGWKFPPLAPGGGEPLIFAHTPAVLNPQDATTTSFGPLQNVAGGKRLTPSRVRRGTSARRPRAGRRIERPTSALAPAGTRPGSTRRSEPPAKSDIRTRPY